jgi:endonuclease/exonuclease/phosphatase family metal-dependent hydrolase
MQHGEVLLCMENLSAQDRFKMWELIRRIQPCRKTPWLMIGDFNEAMWSSEHFSCHKRPAKQMLDFREVLSHCDLHDIGFTGLP